MICKWRVLNDPSAPPMASYPYIYQPNTGPASVCRLTRLIGAGNRLHQLTRAHARWKTTTEMRLSLLRRVCLYADSSCIGSVLPLYLSKPQRVRQIYCGVAHTPRAS